MTSTARVPTAEITGLFGAMVKRMCQKRLGEVPESLGVIWHHKPVLKALFGFSGKAEKWDACDLQLKSFAHMLTASRVGCTWCLDFGYFEANNRDLDMDKAREIPRWRESELFTPLERDVLEYAEAMATTPTSVTDELFRAVAGTARRARADRADGVHRHGQPGHPHELLARHRVAGVLGGVRTPAAGRAHPERRFSGMTDDPFVVHRSLLFTVGYEILGSAADAEDVVQETWLRWSGVDQSEVRDPRAYLVRIVTRQAINRLRTLARRREDYIGEWLPEPLLISPDVAEDVELAESVSIAMLTVLETLGPAERAVFVLREVFDTPYDEIAEAVGKTPAAVRQIAHRAREHVAARRPRVQVSQQEQQAVIDRFLKAVMTGDLQGLLDVLAPDVALIADGGGIASAVLIPIEGADVIARLLSKFTKRAPVGATFGSMWLNGAPAAKIDIDGVLDTAISMVIEDGRITHIFAIRNPEKLTRLDVESALSR